MLSSIFELGDYSRTNFRKKIKTWKRLPITDYNSVRPMVFSYSQVWTEIKCLVGVRRSEPQVVYCVLTVLSPASRQTAQVKLSTEWRFVCWNWAASSWVFSHCDITCLMANNLSETFYQGQVFGGHLPKNYIMRRVSQKWDIFL